MSRIGLRDVLLASRPVSWVNTAYPFAAAYWLGARDVDARLVVGTLFFLIPYNLLMYGVNDVFDHASDLANPRKGGAEGALLDARALRPLLWTSLLLPVPFLVVLLVWSGPWAAVALLVTVGAVLAYSLPGLRFKERPVLDSVTSSTHFTGPAVFGALLSTTAVPGSVWVVLAAFFLWGLSSHAFGAVQDIEADRAGGIGSLATVFGARAVVRASAVVYVLSGALLLLGHWPAPLAAVVPLAYAVMVARHWRVTDATATSTHAGWRRFLVLNYVAGFVVTQLLIFTEIRT